MWGFCLYFRGYANDQGKKMESKVGDIEKKNFSTENLC